MKINPIKQKVFKVVMHPQDKLTSVMAHSLPVDYRLQYFPGQIVRPISGSRIFAFSTLADAKKFGHGLLHAEIWESEAYGAKDGYGNNRLMLTNFDVVRLKQFWNRTLEYSHSWTDANARGTILCKSIKLLKKVASWHQKSLIESYWLSH